MAMHNVISLHQTNVAQQNKVKVNEEMHCHENPFLHRWSQ